MKKRIKPVYVTRDTYGTFAEVWPETVGIRKFHGCVQYGAAWKRNHATGCLYRNNKNGYIEKLNRYGCKKRYGFYPRKGTAWYINSRGKATQEHLAFSP